MEEVTPGHTWPHLDRRASGVAGSGRIGKALLGGMGWTQTPTVESTGVFGGVLDTLLSAH